MHWFFKFLILVLILGTIYSTIAYGIPKILPIEKVANSEIHGLIFRRQEWEGIIRITGDLVTMPGASITIAPGTQILVGVKDDKFNIDYLPWHLKNGINTLDSYHGVKKNEPFWDETEKIQIHLSRVLAIGTKEQQITIRSDTAFPSPYDFNSLRVDSGVLAFVNFSNYRRFEISGEVVLRNAVFNETGECSVCIKGGSPTIIDSFFGPSLRESIWIERASPRIANNLFNNLSGDGIRINTERRAAPYISHNTFEMPGRVVIDILNGGEIDGGVISFNIFSGNTVINIACDSKMKISENNLFSLISFKGSGCGGSYLIGANYWGIAELKTILSERITNKDKLFDVKISSILKSPPTGAGRRVKTED